MEKIRTKMGFQCGFFADRRNRRGGLALFWKDTINLRVESYSIGHIDATISSGEGEAKWRFTSFYGNPVTQHRKQS